MRTMRNLFIINLLAGISVSAVGIIMILIGAVSTDIHSDRFGRISEGAITGPGALSIGIVLLLLSIVTYRWSKQEKKKIEKMD